MKKVLLKTKALVSGLWDVLRDKRADEDVSAATQNLYDQATTLAKVANEYEEKAAALSRPKWMLGSVNKPIDIPYDLDDRTVSEVARTSLAVIGESAFLISSAILEYIHKPLQRRPPQEGPLSRAWQDLEEETRYLLRHAMQLQCTAAWTAAALDAAAVCSCMDS